MYLYYMSGILLCYFTENIQDSRQVLLTVHTNEATDTQGVTVMSAVTWLINGRPRHPIHACLLPNLTLSPQECGFISAGYGTNLD